MRWLNAELCNVNNECWVGKCHETRIEKDEFLAVLKIRKKVFTVRRKANRLFKAEGSVWLKAHLAISLQTGNCSKTFPRI